MNFMISLWQTLKHNFGTFQGESNTVEKVSKELHLLLQIKRGGDEFYLVFVCLLV